MGGEVTVRRLRGPGLHDVEVGVDDADLVLCLRGVEPQRIDREAEALSSLPPLLGNLAPPPAARRGWRSAARQSSGPAPSP